MQVVWCVVPEAQRIVEHEREAGSPDFSGEPALLVEAAGQLFHLFRDGLDYAFILHRKPMSGMRGVLSGLVYRILGPAPVRQHFSRSMSLYRAGRVSLVPPLGVATSLSRQRVHRMSPVITSPLRAKATIAFLRIN